MARNPAAQTAFGPMVLAAVEQNEPPGRRLVDDDLADLFLPAPLRCLVAATRWGPARQLMIRGSEWTGPGLWANLACRKRFIGDKLLESRGEIDAVVILGAGFDTRAYQLTRQIRIPVFEVDLPVNIARKLKTVRRALGELPLSVRLVAVDFERDDLLTAMAEHGYHTDYRAFFICEGVTQYLTEDAVRRMLEGLRPATPGSRPATRARRPRPPARRPATRPSRPATPARRPARPRPPSSRRPSSRRPSSSILIVTPGRSGFWRSTVAAFAAF